MGWWLLLLLSAADAKKPRVQETVAVGCPADGDTARYRVVTTKVRTKDGVETRTATTIQVTLEVGEIGGERVHRVTYGHYSSTTPNDPVLTAMNASVGDTPFPEIAITTGGEPHIVDPAPLVAMVTRMLEAGRPALEAKSGPMADEAWKAIMGVMADPAVISGMFVKPIATPGLFACTVFDEGTQDFEIEQPTPFGVTFPSKGTLSIDEPRKGGMVYSERTSLDAKEAVAVVVARMLPEQAAQLEAALTEMPMSFTQAIDVTVAVDGWPTGWTSTERIAVGDTQGTVTVIEGTRLSP